MTLKDLVGSVAGFQQWTHTEKIKLFAWYLHFYQNKDAITGKDIKVCYEQLHMEEPSSIPPFLDALVKKKPKEMIKEIRGYKLEHRVRENFESKYAQRSISVQVSRLLEELPNRIPELSEKIFLSEAIVCLKHGAFRSAIVMTWNLAFFHFCSYIVALPGRIDAFNKAWKILYPKDHKSEDRFIRTLEDFGEELKEGQVIDIAVKAGIITSEIAKIMKPKLQKRNSAAHPSMVSIEQLQAEEFIDDLIKNVVLKLGY